MTLNQNTKPWAENHPSPYEGHDLTHRPEWGNIIVWDAYLNNLTAGFMVISGITWLVGGPIFTALLPFALTLALVIVLIDLVLLVADLGDPPRFIHALRVLHFTSPLSVGVWGLTCYASCLGVSVALYWLSFISGMTNGFMAPYMGWASVLMKLFTALALVGAVVVICYKGVAFSCTSQPGVKDARWLTSFMVSDALLMATGLYAIMAFSLGMWQADSYLLVPMLVLIVARTVAFSLLYLETRQRARLVYTSENTMIKWIVYFIGGLLAFVLAFFGALGLTAAGALVLVAGIFERYWIIGLTKKI